MTGRAWYFFRKKLRKGNGVRWALAYTWDDFQWQRTVRNPKKLTEWQHEYGD